MLELLEQTATNLKSKDKMNTVGGLLQSSGIVYTLDLSKSLGERIHTVQIDGKDIDLNKRYKVATHSGMLNGIHNYTQFAEGTYIQKTDINLNDFIVQKLLEMKNINFPKNMGEVTMLNTH